MTENQVWTKCGVGPWLTLWPSGGQTFKNIKIKSVRVK